MQHRAADRAVIGALDGRVALACSGGIDSTALLLLAAARLRRDAPPVVVVHVDHGVRFGSAIEADHVAALARERDLPFVRVRAAWSPASRNRPQEHELRGARYTALARLVRTLHLDAVVTAHTLDDQVETILMRLLSGAGGTGATGMRATTSLHTTFGDIEVRRPLLGVSRSELSQLVSSAKVAHVHDPTNEDRSYRRNALRHDIIPLIHSTFPGFGKALARSVTIGAQDARALDVMADEVFRSSALRSDDTVVISRSVVCEGQPAIAGRLIRAAAEELTGGQRRDLTFERVSSVIAAASGRSGAVIELPGGLEAVVGRTDIVFTRTREQRDHTV